MRCGAPPSTDFPITVGNNIYQTCTYDFNNLIGKLSSKQYFPRVYALLVQADDLKFYEVAVFMPASSQPIKRFFLEDTVTSTTKINVLTSLSLTFDLDSNGKLINPFLYPIYSFLPLQSGSIVSNSLVTLTYNVTFNYNVSTFWTGALASFISVCVIAVIHAIGKTYIGHLNKKSALLFFINLLNTWSLWTFYYLLILTGYWFLLTKTTSSLFILIPTDSTFYTAFYVLVGLVTVTRIITILIDKSDKLQT
jgi:hypothetical protein